MDEPIEPIQPDPLLTPGAFIDPNPTSNGTHKRKSQVGVKKTGVNSNGNSKPELTTTDQKGETPGLGRPDWLPPGWTFVERVRASGASAGSRDKYYVDPVTQRRFRSKKEVLYFLETGTTKKKKNDSDAENTPGTDSATVKRKKSEAKAKDSLKNFNFDDVPAKVKWVLTDIYEGSWRPLSNGVDRVPESAKQEWTAAFTYLTLQNAGRATFI